MQEKRYRRRRKTGISLLIAYLIRGGGVLLVVLCIAALVWGGMSLAHLLAPGPDPVDSSEDGSGVQQPPTSSGDISSQQVTPDPKPEPKPDPKPDPAPTPDPDPVVAVQVVIDAGHGGGDPGTSSGTAVEKDIALQLALLLQQKLEAEGITTLMTRSEDVGMTMADRVELANQAGALLYISLHCNSFEEDERVMGLECHYWQSDESLALARIITQQVGQAGIKTREVKMSEFVVLRDTEMTAVIIETGFLTNAQDRERLTSPDSQEILVGAVTKAVKATLDRMAA